MTASTILAVVIIAGTVAIVVLFALALKLIRELSRIEREPK